ncbi:MAG: anaerobic ribonucleoside-triphosphate reductase activating protein [Bacteroidia bacterium]
MLNKKIIHDITPFTLLDFPNKTGCILWFAGCNMRCVYCYNPDIVLGKGKKTIKEALDFINTRKGLLDGIVLSGGECTLYKELPEIAREIKQLGFLVKLDTNGSNPECVHSLINEHLVDYVSLDFKAMPDKYKSITQSDFFVEFEKTFLLLKQSSIPFEVRTTVHSDLLSYQDIQAMISYLEKHQYSGKFYLQNYLNNTETIGNIKNTHQKISISQFSPKNFEVVVRN